jgi:hypothetical protein
MAIHISVHSVPRQIAWSVIYCPYCQQLEAGRCDEYIQVTSIWFIPVSRDVSGRGGRCDFCERPASQWMSTNSVPIKAWAPNHGIAKLFSLLQMPSETPIPSSESEARLHSLLSSIEEKCAFNGMDVRLGLALGGILGAAACGGTLAVLVQRGFRIGELDGLGTIFASILVGGLLGVILGGALQIVFTRHSVATRQLREAYARHGIDLKKLQEIAVTHSTMIRRALRRLRDTVSMSR